MTDDMTRSELMLLLSFGCAVVAHAGRITTEAGYQNVTADQVAAIGRKVEDVLTDVIVGLREPGPAPTLEDLPIVMREVALGAVLAILGEPPERAPAAGN